MLWLQPSKHHPPGPTFPGALSLPATDSQRRARPGPAPLRHHTSTGTSRMEPTTTMADLIRISTDGNGARS